MLYVLENEVLRVEVDSHGAEIKSVCGKKSGHEYMWQADPTYWGRTAPVLFPFVGSLKNKEFILEGKHYPMGQHGFARDMEFDLVEQEADHIWMKLVDTEETRAKFPFAFALSIGYELKESKVAVLWKVENPGKEPLYFSIGAHPAFNCPIHGEDDKVGYKLYFEGVNEIHHHGNDRASGLCLKEDLVLPLENGRATITKPFFDRCTYMIENKQTGCVGIEDPSGKRFVTVYFDTPLFAIWSPEEKNAPFLCIEPWFGRADGADFAGELKDREYGNCLAPGQIFNNRYQIAFELEE